MIIAEDFADEKKQSALSPTSIYARIVGTDSHKLQLMKASFFDNEDYNDGKFFFFLEISENFIGYKILKKFRKAYRILNFSIN